MLAEGDHAPACFAPLFFNNMTLVLDRYFVHRLRQVTGKDRNPLNEVELLTEALMNNDGVLRGNKVVKFVPEESVLKLNVGDRIRLSAAEFDRLAKAFLADIKAQVPIDGAATSRMAFAEPPLPKRLGTQPVRAIPSIVRGVAAP